MDKINRITTVYIIGGPGSGKSSVADAVFSGMGNPYLVREPIVHLVYDEISSPIVRIGGIRDHFSGTDTLSMSAANKIDDFYWSVSKSGVSNIIFGEGDRFAISRFMDTAKKHGNLHLFYMDISEDLSAARRFLRASQADVPEQNAGWVKSRFTKHAQLAEAYSATRIDASGDIKEIAKTVLATMKIA
jgi:adenylate kinase family enzyme